MAAITIVRDLFADPAARATISYAVGGRCWHQLPLRSQAKAGPFPAAEIFGLRLDRRPHVAAIAKLAQCTVPKGDSRFDGAARGKRDSLGLIP